MTIESANGKHTLEMSDQAYKDLLDIWGIDMKKFAKNFLDMKQNVQRAGKWNFRMTHSLSDGGDSDRPDSVGFEFFRKYGFSDEFSSMSDEAED